MPLRPAQRGQPERRELELQRADIPFAQAQVMGEVRRAQLVLGQRGFDPRTLARLLFLDRIPEREEVRAKCFETLSPPVAHVLPRSSGVPSDHGSLAIPALRLD